MGLSLSSSGLAPTLVVNVFSRREENTTARVKRQVHIPYKYLASAMRQRAKKRQHALTDIWFQGHLREEQAPSLLDDCNDSHVNAKML
jgi:hypothetical protein